MPGGDRTGPMGAGPMTGRGAGFCAGTARPGLGRGWGRRMGARFRGWWHAGRPALEDPTQEREVLEQEVSRLKAQMEQVQNRLTELGDSR